MKAMSNDNWNLQDILKDSEKRIEITRSEDTFTEWYTIWLNDESVGSIHHARISDGYEVQIWQNNQDLFFSRTYRTLEIAKEKAQIAMETFVPDFLFKQLTQVQKDNLYSFWNTYRP
jgi:hypothetical protein